MRNSHISNRNHPASRRLITNMPLGPFVERSLICPPRRPLTLRASHNGREIEDSNNHEPNDSLDIITASVSVGALTGIGLSMFNFPWAWKAAMGALLITYLAGFLFASRSDKQRKSQRISIPRLIGGAFSFSFIPGVALDGMGVPGAWTISLGIVVLITCLGLFHNRKIKRNS